MSTKRDYAYKIVRKNAPTNLENLGTVCMAAAVLAMLVYMFCRMFLPAVLP